MPLPSAAARYEDPFDDGLHSDDLEDHVVTLLQYKAFLSDDQKNRLMSLFDGGEGPPANNIYSADFDLWAEVGYQIAAVRAIREKVVDNRGRLRGETALREAKEVITTGGTLLNTLMKHLPEIRNMNRQRLIENAVIEALREVSPELRDRVLQLLDQRLEGV